MNEGIRDLGVIKYSGSNTQLGKSYHSFDGCGASSQRGNIKPRLDIILGDYSVKNKHGLDLGCNIGGFCFTLGESGAKMTGIDHDAQSINVASIHKGEKEWPNFIVSDIDLDVIKANIKDKKFVVWFSQWMWFVSLHGIDKGKEALYEIGKSGCKMFFETSLGDGTVGKVMKHHGINRQSMKDILRGCFKTVKDVGVGDQWRTGRPIYICSGEPGTKWKGYGECTVERVDYKTVKKKSSESRMKREKDNLVKLDNRHFPKFLREDEDSIYTEYSGCAIEKLPVNWEKQCNEILGCLKTAGIVHRDIRPKNLLIDGGIIKLIDFEWAGDGSGPLPAGLGSDYKCPDGFNDRYSLLKSMEHYVH